MAVVVQVDVEWDEQGWGRPVSGDGVGQGFDDRWAVYSNRCAQAAGPAESARVRLLVRPAAVVFHPVIMATDVAEVSLDGGSTAGMVLTGGAPA